MLYSDLYLKSRSKTPSALVVIALVAVLGFFISFGHLPQQPIRASKQQVINQTLVNVAPRDVGIFWETGDKTVSWIISGTSANNLTVTTLDERDIASQRMPSRYHFVHLTDLQENSTYYYRLVSGNDVFPGQSDKPFSFTTPQNVDPITSIEPAYGTVLKPNGDPAANTIVRVNYPGAYPLMALAKIDGAWLTPVSYLFDIVNTRLMAPDENAQISLDMFADDTPKTTVKTTLHGASPLPQSIILGTDYNLIPQENVLPASTGEPPVSPKQNIQILYPKEKSIVPGQNPLIKGIAYSGSDVSVKINTRPQTSFIVQADKSGVWMVSDPVTIKSGDYVMTVATTDKQGKLVTLTRNFSIAKSGDQVLAAASGPATLTSTPAILPTSTIAPIPTVPPQPTYAIATSTPPPPVTGLNPTYMLGGSVLLILLGAGVMLFL